MSDIAGQPKATKVVVATTVALSFISFWRAAAIVLATWLVGILCRRHRRAGHRAKRSLVHPGRDALQFCGSLRLHGKLQHVRSRRRLCRCPRLHGSVHGAAVGFRAHLRLHSDRPHQHRQRGPVPGPLYSTRSAEMAHWHAAHVHGDCSPRFSASLVTSISGGATSKGIHESSGKALRIMQITTVMVVMFLIWCPHHAAAARSGADSACAAARQSAIHR